MNFAEHKETTASDCEAVITLLTEIAAAAREGNLGPFQKFWIEGGTEEGDSKVASIREMMILRFHYRDGVVNGEIKERAGKEKGE